MLFNKCECSNRNFKLELYICATRTATGCCGKIIEMKRITIRDLAKMLQLSPSTVSRALSDHPDISDKTKLRVKETAESFNYSVNLHSSFFRNKKSNLIALIIPEMNMFYIPNMINAINDYLYSTDYSLFVFISNDKFKREKKILEQCIKWAVEGVLISPSSETKNSDHLESLKLAGIKTVILDKVLRNTEFSSVSINNINSAKSAVVHLLEKGHRFILGIFGNPNISISKERIEGFKLAHSELGIEYREENIITVNDINELDSILPIVLLHNVNISALFCMSDEILAKVHFHLIKFGKCIFDDVSLISISDGSFPYMTYPRISFVKDSGKKMGRKACDLLIKRISNKEFTSTHLELETKLIQLDSVKDLNKV